MHRCSAMINILNNIFFKKFDLTFSLIKKNKQMAAQYVPFGYYDKISVAEMWKLPCGYFISIVNYAVWNAEANI